MANWFHDLGLFLFAVFAHWQALLTGGIVIAAVGFYERKKRELPWEAYVFIATMFGLYSVFAAWQDEHRNTNSVTTEKAAEVALKNTCLQDARVEHAYMDGLQGLNASQRQTIDKQQQANDAQQRDVSSCVVSLGKMNPVIRERISVVPVSIGTYDIAGHIPISAQHAPTTIIPKRFMTELFIITNEPERNFHGTLKCDDPFDFLDTPVVPTDAGATMRSGNPPVRINDGSYEIRYDATSTEWNPSHPAYMRVSSKSQNLGKCSFVPME
jgi:hypothetical protein